jgi:hypothetical protein
MCNGQRPVKSSQRVTISTMSCIPRKVDKTISPRKYLRLWLFPRKPSIASGATSIESVDHIPDEKKRKEKKFFCRIWRCEESKEQIFLSLYSKKFFDYSLGGYSHRERWSRTQWKLQIMRVMEQALEYITKYLVKKWTSDICYLLSYTHREGFLTSQGFCNPKILDIKIVNQGYSDWNYDSRVASSRQNMNAVIVKDHEGKTSGSILYDLVYAPECALLVIFHIYDAKTTLILDTHIIAPCLTDLYRRIHPTSSSPDPKYFI